MDAQEHQGDEMIAHQEMKKTLSRANRTCAKDISPKWTPPALQGRLGVLSLRANARLTGGLSADPAAFEGRQTPSARMG